MPKAFSEFKANSIKYFLEKKGYIFLPEHVFTERRTLGTKFHLKELSMRVLSLFDNNRPVHQQIKIDGKNSHSIALTFIKTDDLITIEVFDPNGFHPHGSIMLNNDKNDYWFPNIPSELGEVFPKMLSKSIQFEYYKTLVLRDTKTLINYLETLKIELSKQYTVNILSMCDLALNYSEHCNTWTLYYHQMRDLMQTSKDTLNLVRRLRFSDINHIYSRLDNFTQPFIHPIGDLILKRHTYHFPIQFDKNIKLSFLDNLNIVFDNSTINEDNIEVTEEDLVDLYYTKEILEFIWGKDSIENKYNNDLLIQKSIRKPKSIKFTNLCVS